MTVVNSISGNSKIVLKGDYGRHEEGPLAGAASPGMNLVSNNVGQNQERHTWLPGPTSRGGAGTDSNTSQAPIRVLKIDTLQGKGPADAYASGDNAFIYIPLAGDVIQVLVAAGQNVAKENGLSAQPDGRWILDDVNACVEALESTNGALAADTLVRVRVF